MGGGGGGFASELLVGGGGGVAWFWKHWPYFRIHAVLRLSDQNSYNL